MKQKVDKPLSSTLESMMHKVESPFTQGILETKLPAKFCKPVIDKYTAAEDLLDHLEGHCSQMDLLDTQDAIKCKAFPITLAGSAWIWFSKLKPNSILGFKELSRVFVSHFIANKRKKKSAIHLLSTRQKIGESLRDYVAQFKQEKLNVEDPGDKVVLTAIVTGLIDRRFSFSLGKNSPFMEKAQKYMNARDMFLARREQAAKLGGTSA